MRYVLSKETFSTVIESAPLVSIDLVFKNTQRETLLGQRLNKPTKEYGFVPDGRILKNESLANAFKRLTREELGQKFSIEQATLLEPYDHFYTDNIFDDSFSTHYVAIAYILEVEQTLFDLTIGEQYDGYQWFDILKISSNNKIHKNTAVYFE